jgi:IclR family transcriptional regulator, KDG regulon repressor
MTRVVAAVSRALDVIEVFMTVPGPLTIAQIGQRVDIPRSTLHELVYTLRERGYLDADSDGFRLGLRLFELGSRYRSRLDLAAAGQEEAQEIVDACDETSQVAILDGTEVVYIAKVEGTNVLRLVSAVGLRLPATCTGVGKALLASLPLGELDARYPTDADLPVMTPNSIRTRRALHAELEATRARGYALDDCESNIAVRCVAAPVIDGSGAAVAAISVSVPTVRWTAGTERQLANLVRRAGTRLSRRIGARIDAGEVA